MMTLRTPRRRISPRTKRRCRAIKDFLKRAIGSPSQPDIKINSSIAVNVTNLKHQIVGIEQQLNEVSKHLLGTEGTGTNESTITLGKSRLTGTETVILNPNASTERSSLQSKTTFLYKTHQDRNSDGSDLINRVESVRNESKYADSGETYAKSSNTKKKNSKHRQTDMEESLSYFGKHKSKSAYERFSSSYPTNSFHSLFEPRNESILRDDNDRHHHSRHDYDGHHHSRHDDDRHHHSRHDYDGHHHPRHATGYDRQQTNERVKSHKHISHTELCETSRKRTDRYEDKRERKRKEKLSREHLDLDPDFINNIIKRQYKPVKMFGRKQSDLSQFSAPVCRDQEFKNNENILRGSDLCSCCYADRKHYVQYNNLSDMRSICDTRLYSSKRNTRHKDYRRESNYNYNDSLMYDVVPVREKCSPKVQRKYVEDAMCYPNYKEVPPSPRTLRPRLNLKAQHFSNLDLEEEEYYDRKKRLPIKINRHDNYNECCHNNSLTMMERNMSSNMKQNRENVQQIGRSHYGKTLHSPQLNNVDTNAEQVQATSTDTNKSQDIETATDKTDKALCEIKDILQHFLQEIKKESVSLESSGKGEQVPLTSNKQNNIKINTSFDEPGSHSDSNNCGIGPFTMPPSYMTPPFMNPCCYPLFPTYPMNCMQNSFPVPSPSFTCACAKVESPISTNKDSTPDNNTKKINTNTETEKLIKEIYNLVTQSPPPTRKKDDKNKAAHDSKERKTALVTRSVGDSIRITRHDAKVGTPKLKYYSKSCEAIGSPLDEELTARTTASFSDTFIGKMSLAATGADSTSFDTEISTDLTSDKKDEGRFAKVLRSFGLLKKKNKEAVEEEELEEEEGSESEISTDDVVKKKKKHPEFPQEIINYAMHGQEYFHPPPMMPPLHHHDYLAHQQSFVHHYSPYPGYASPLVHPTAPPCPCTTSHVDPQYLPNQHIKQPEVPLCLKEIEVRSTATQSDKKVPFFGKFGRRKSQDLPPLMEQKSTIPPPRNCCTQTAQNKPGFWKRLNTPKLMTESDPRVFSFNKHKELAARDAKLKSAMLKKLFHKRNPFSPNNLIVKTLLGKDPSSFGNPPPMTRPKFFA